MRQVPWWGVVSSAASPVLLIAGWTVAAMLQPPSFNPVADTVSALMAPGATDRWVMTLAFLVVGVCYVVTGTALRPAAPTGRLILIAGALAGMMVAANPEHPVGTSVPHVVWASLGLAGLAAWPAGAWRRGSSVPWSLRRAVCFGVIAVQLILLTWFVAELVTGGGQVGLAERVVGAAQALWPLAVVLSCRVRPPVTSRSLASRSAGLAAGRIWVLPAGEVRRSGSGTGHRCTQREWRRRPAVVGGTGACHADQCPVLRSGLDFRAEAGR